MDTQHGPAGVVNRCVYVCVCVRLFLLGPGRIERFANHRGYRGWAVVLYASIQLARE